jgi:hypothetical protein
MSYVLLRKLQILYLVLSLTSHTGTILDHQQLTVTRVGHIYFFWLNLTNVLLVVVYLM